MNVYQFTTLETIKCVVAPTLETALARWHIYARLFPDVSRDFNSVTRIEVLATDVLMQTEQL